MRIAWAIVLGGFLSLAAACISQEQRRPTHTNTIWAIPLTPEGILTMGEEFAFELAGENVRIIDLETGAVSTVERSAACSSNRFHIRNPATLMTGLPIPPFPARIKTLGGGYWQLWGECEPFRGAGREEGSSIMSRPQTVVMNSSGEVVLDLAEVSESYYTWTIFWKGKFWRATKECLFEIEPGPIVRRVGCSESPTKYEGVLWYRDRPIVAFESCSDLPAGTLDCVRPDTIQWKQAMLYVGAKDFPIWEIKESGNATYFVSEDKTFGLEDGELRRLPHRQRTTSEFGRRFKEFYLPDYMGRKVKRSENSDVN